MTLQELFKTTNQWSKTVMAKNSKELPCDPFDRDAKSWCLLGGIQKCYGPMCAGRFTGESSRVFNQLSAEIKDKPMATWNDSEFRTFAEIRALIEQANV